MRFLFICFGDGILTLFEYLGYYHETRFIGGVAGCFGLGPRHLTVSEPYLGLSLSSRRVQEVNRRISSWPALGPGMHHTCLRILLCAFTMGSGVIFYEHEKCEKFEDYDMKAGAELGTFKTRRYHLDDESFVHPLHSVRFDPDHPYEIPIEALMANKILSSSKDERSSTGRSRSSKRPTPHYSPRRMPVAHPSRVFAPSVVVQLVAH
ncbi:hypothetical protein PIB30_004554 [Stylosanthes scabra]|uniref:Uncharacterized protein n=1 Tax=Stylosanthes scabra TaxID=79078 RepID=A0ABU6Y0E4_9FABA|nr:hypothetical protein [Stylosanthes scabra]